MRVTRVFMALLSLGLSVGSPAQDAFGPQAVPVAARSFRLGTMKLTSLHDAQYVVPNDGKTFGVDAGAAAVGELLRAHGEATDRITLSVNSLLVRDGARTLLIDTGLGPKAHGELMPGLQAAGVSPGSVTDVLITHSHGDHVGGLVDANGRLAFPKAKIRMAAKEWDWFKTQGDAALIKTITPQVHTFEPGARIAPGIRSIALDGHTPGHVGYEITSGRDRLLDIGDLAHSSIVSLAKPGWTLGFDWAAELAKATRMTTIAMLAKNQELIYSPHFPYPGVGRIDAEGDAFAWKAGVP